MDEMNLTKRGAIIHLLKIILQRVIGFALFIAAAGTITDLRGNIYFLVYFISAVVACGLMHNGHQEVLSAREKNRETTKSWDKALMPILVLLLFFGIYLVAGFGVRFGWVRISDMWLYIGDVCFMLSCVFSIWPLLENRHFEGTVRIQSDREQTVISTGPYRIVRHPAYLGGIIGMVAVALIFGTLPVAITAAAVIALFVVRTYLEDTTLKNELTGYLVYADRVKYRLFPFVW
jgi:protein-S-isoprenylcysteine O-methyltransferase Ste14